MNVVKRAWASLVTFVTTTEDATPLALVRMVCAATVFFHVVHLLANGAATFAWTDEASGGIATHFNYLITLLGGATPTTIVLLSTLLAAAALSLALGFRTRASLIATYVLWRTLVETTVDARSAYDTLITNTLFLLALSQCGNALSLDARRRGGPTPAPRWPRILLVFQIGMLYGGSAMMKASSGWVPGGDASALWYILHQPLWARFATLPHWTYPLTQVATTIVWCFELLGPVFVISVLLSERGRRRWRTFRNAYLCVGTAMHLGIEVTMEVGAFTGASLALYGAALKADEWRALWARMTRKRSTTATNATTTAAATASGA